MNNEKKLRLQDLHACFIRNNPCFDFKTDMDLKDDAQTRITWII